MGQSRVTMRMLRESLADVADEYRWLDSGTRMQVTHKKSATRMRVLSSSGKRSLGLEGWRIIVADEPSAWETRGGELQYHALRQAIGKREGQRLLLIGTRAPAEAGSWWLGLIDGGSRDGVAVLELSAPTGKPWDAWPTIRAANPMARDNPALRRQLLRERDEARDNQTMRPAFEAFRLNRTVGGLGSEVLVTLPDWRRVEARPVPPREGRPVVGLDLGASRAWSAAWCLWPNGRSEAYAVLPGVPSLAVREKQDSQPRGLYGRLVESGALVIDEGVRISRVSTLIDHLLSVGLEPDIICCDLFQLPALRDAVAGRWPIIPRRARYSEATSDIAAFRKLVADGPLSIAAPSRKLALLGLGEAAIKGDDQGSCRLVKRRGRASRDDVAQSGVMAAGALSRIPVEVPADWELVLV